MKDSPLLLKTDLVRATLEGRKTQTRRPVKGLKVRLRRDVSADPLPWETSPLVLEKGVYKAAIGDAGAVCAIDVRGKMLGLKPGEFDFVCPYSDGPTYLADYGDRKGWRVEANASTVWVRENHCVMSGTGIVIYQADWKEGGIVGAPKWTPSVHMFRVDSRVTRPLTSIRLERVNAITEADARAEGLGCYCGTCGYCRTPASWRTMFRANVGGHLRRRVLENGLVLGARMGAVERWKVMERELFWKANDGSQHRSKQSAAVADAMHAIFLAVDTLSDVPAVGDVDNSVTAVAITENADEFLALLTNLAKARAALAKHEAKGEK